MKIPLRERRAQQKGAKPWEKTPSWQVERLPQQIAPVQTTRIPAQLPYLNHDRGYNRVACEMPLRSHELFHYRKLKLFYHY